MPFVKVGTISSLPPGSVMQTSIGNEVYAICNIGGELHALYGTCPHAGGPLGEGEIQETRLVCPWHEWAYDCRTGENDENPQVRVPKYPVRIDGDDIFVNIP